MENSFNHAEIDEKFLHGDSKVDQLMKLLDDVVNANKTDAEATKKGDDKKNAYNLDDFCVLTRPKSSSITKSKYKATIHVVSLNSFPFMMQMDKTLEERTKARLEREHIAQVFRAIANDHYHKNNIERAIFFYTKAIENIKDSPILYCNRAISFIKLRKYKRAIIDCDFVLNKLDFKHLKAWLYRSAAYSRSNDTVNFDISMNLARQLNPKEHNVINQFLHRMKTEL